jgi:gamma-aminobutyric acid receptor subunit beta
LRSLRDVLAPGVTAIVSLLFCSAALGANRCDGPEECCPSHLVENPREVAQVALGVVVVGLYNVNEKTGTWDADYYLYEGWKPVQGFSPQTEVVNEVTRQSEQFDSVEIRHGQCIRTRRIYSTLHNDYNLRRFPFDRERLQLTFSDADYDSSQVAYDSRAYAAGLADETRQSLSSWKIEGDLSFGRDSRSFAWEESAPKYDYGNFSFEIRRHVTHHVIKFFIPLFVIVMLAFLVFWIDPEDLSSQVNIGVTCVLSAIAFQFVQASTLPEVAYTTLTDRVYVISYIAIALALAQSVYGNSLVRHKDRDRALALGRRSRWVFPLLTVAALAAVVIWSFGQQ